MTDKSTLYQAHPFHSIIRSHGLTMQVVRALLNKNFGKKISAGRLNQLLLGYDPMPEALETMIRAIIAQEINVSA